MIFNGRFSYQSAEQGSQGPNESLSILSQDAVQALRDMLRRAAAQPAALQPARMPHNFAK